MSRMGSISLYTRDAMSTTIAASEFESHFGDESSYQTGDQRVKHPVDEHRPKGREKAGGSHANANGQESPDLTIFSGVASTNDCEPVTTEAAAWNSYRILRTTCFLVLLILPSLAIMASGTDESPRFYYTYGCILSILISCRIFWEYFQMTKGNKTSMYAQSPLVTLMISAVFFDFLFCVSVLVDIQTDLGCVPFAQITQLSILASISYTSLMSLDMLLRMELSFTHHDSYINRYHAFVMLTSIPSIVFVSRYNGEEQFYACWFEIREENVEEFKEQPKAEVLRMLFLSIPLILYYFFSLMVIGLGYYRLESSKTNSQSWTRSVKLHSTLKDILGNLTKQTMVIGVYYIILGTLYLTYEKPQDQNTKDANYYIVRLFALWVSIKAFPSLIIWRIKMSKPNPSNPITLEEMALLSLAKTVRIDIINSCCMCIRETAEMTAGPSEEHENIQENDFDSELHLNFFGDRSGMQFKFKSYAMRVFRQLREDYGVETEEYVKSFPHDKDIRERFSERRGGRFTYITENSRFIVKTIDKTEKDALLELLPDYYHYLHDNKKSLLGRYMGLHSMMMYGRKTYLVVLANIAPSPLMKRYEIRGVTKIPRQSPFSGLPQSTGIRIDDDEALRSSQMTLKDSDITRELPLRFVREDREFHVDMISQDTNFLSSHGLIGYNLLIAMGQPGNRLRPKSTHSNTMIVDEGTFECPKVYVGIIDFARKYTWLDAIENFYKTRVLCRPTSDVYVAEPETYARRLLRFFVDNSAHYPGR